MRRLGWCLLVILLGSCMRPTQAVMEDVDPYGWQSGVALEIENGDTATLRDLYLVVRTNRLFRADSLRVRVTLLTPDSCHYSEEVGFAMQHHHSPAALRTIRELPYRRRSILDHIGTYTLHITPLKALQGIEAVGFNIIKSEEPTHEESPYIGSESRK